MNYGHRERGQVQCAIRRSKDLATGEPCENVSVLDCYAPRHQHGSQDHRPRCGPWAFVAAWITHMSMASDGFTAHRHQHDPEWLHSSQTTTWSCAEAQTTAIHRDMGHRDMGSQPYQDHRPLTSTCSPATAWPTDAHCLIFTSRSGGPCFPLNSLN